MATPSGQSLRWARVVDILEDATLYTEEAERLRPADLRLPADEMERAKVLHELADLVHDKIVFFRVLNQGEYGTLEVDLWVGEMHVNAALREKGYV